MKKEYIAPMAVVRSLEIENAFCAVDSIHDKEGDGNQFGKEYDYDDDEDDFWD